MLTYETIDRIVKEEKKSNKHVKLPKNFFEDVRLYLNKKEKITEKEDEWELNSVKGLLQGLLEEREKKIILMAHYYVSSGIAPENLTEEEKAFFDKIMAEIKAWQEKKKAIMESKPEPKMMVVMTAHLPKFVGLNLKNHGPFSPGDIATLPEPNAKLLIEKGIAKEISVKEQ